MIAPASCKWWLWWINDKKKKNQVCYTQTHKSPPVNSEYWGELKQRGGVCWLTIPRNFSHVLLAILRGHTGRGNPVPSCLQSHTLEDRSLWRLRGLNFQFHFVSWWKLLRNLVVKYLLWAKYGPSTAKPQIWIYVQDRTQLYIKASKYKT